jgi:hypothetical protein
MSNQSALNDIVMLALKWRYSHPSDAQFSHVQQFEDGRELIEILRKHGVEIPMDFAMKEIYAPARVVSQEELKDKYDGMTGQAVPLQGSA